jgi:hypothetical protein
MIVKTSIPPKNMRNDVKLPEIKNFLAMRWRENPKIPKRAIIENMSFIRNLTIIISENLI